MMDFGIAYMYPMIKLNAIRRIDVLFGNIIFGFNVLWQSNFTAIS